MLGCVLNTMNCFHLRSFLKLSNQFGDPACNVTETAMRSRPCGALVHLSLIYVFFWGYERKLLRFKVNFSNNLYLLSCFCVVACASSQTIKPALSFPLNVSSSTILYPYLQHTAPSSVLPTQWFSQESVGQEVGRGHRGHCADDSLILPDKSLTETPAQSHKPHCVRCHLLIHLSVSRCGAAAASAAASRAHPSEAEASATTHLYSYRQMYEEIAK